MVVVVRDVVFQDSMQVPPPMMSIRPVTSARTVRAPRSAYAFARGQRGGIFTTSILPAGRSPRLANLQASQLCLVLEPHRGLGSPGTAAVSPRIGLSPREDMWRVTAS